MEPTYRWTFWEPMTYRQQCLDWLDEKRGELTAESVQLYLTARDPSFWPPDILQKPGVQRVWAGWIESPPEWMTDEWKQNLPETFFIRFFPGESRLRVGRKVLSGPKA